MYGRDEEKFEDHPGWYFSVFDTMKYYIQLGAPLEKMVMGMPLYGRGMTLEDPEVNGLYCPASDGKLFIDILISWRRWSLNHWLHDYYKVINQ